MTQKRVRKATFDQRRDKTLRSIEALARATWRSLEHPQVMNVSDCVFSNLDLIAQEAVGLREAAVVPTSRQHALAMIAGALQYLEDQDGR